MSAVSETRARRKIRQAVEAKGCELTTLTWEPLRPGGEKEGLEGGWYGEVRTPFDGVDWVMGYSWQEAVEWVEKWVDPFKSSPLGWHP